MRISNLSPSFRCNVLALGQLIVTASFLSASVIAATVSIAVNPLVSTVSVGANQQFTATLSNTTKKTVIWRVNNVPGGSPTLGTIDATGKYVAPTVLPTIATVTISAVSVADPTKSAGSSVQILALAPVVTKLTPSTVIAGNAFTLSLTGQNFGPNAVVSVDDKTAVTVVARSGNTLTFSGKTTSVPGTVLHVNVTNPGPRAMTSSSLSVNVIAPISVSVSPQSPIIRGLTTFSFWATVSNTTNKNVNWYVNGIAGGNANVGTISTTGTYSAPAVVPSNVTISAVSVADPSKSGSSTATLWNPMPSITSAPTSLAIGGPASIQVSGVGFAQSAQVTLGGVPLTVKWNSPISLTVNVPEVKYPVGGILALQVVNGAPGTTANSAIWRIPAVNSAATLTYAAAKRFLEQATWGATPADIVHVQTIGIDAWINEQMDSTRTPASQYAPQDTSNAGLSYLQAQFFQHALTGADQLRQRVAFALSEVLTVSGGKLTTYSQMRPFEQLLVDNAFSNYRTLLRDVTLSPSMGKYLDMVNNNIPSNQNGANENYARELMQLFSIGLTELNSDGTTPPNAISTYSQTDVQGLARIFTGWTYSPCGSPSQWTNASCFDGPMVAIDSHHDNAAKQLLGYTIQTGSAAGDLDAALDVLMKYQGPHVTTPNIAPFVSKQLIQHLVTSNPDPEYVSRVSQTFERTNGDLKQVVKAILEDPAAGYGNGGAALPSAQGHLREPALYAMSLLRNLAASGVVSTSYPKQSANMGQNVFFPPSVFGYFAPSYTLPSYYLANSEGPVVAPEFQILSGPAAVQRVNYAYTVAQNTADAGISVDYRNLILLATDTNPNTQSASMTTLINALGSALIGAPPSPEITNAILPVLTMASDPSMRVRNAIFLIAASPQYQVIR